MGRIGPKSAFFWEIRTINNPSTIIDEVQHVDL